MRKRDQLWPKKTNLRHNLMKVKGLMFLYDAILSAIVNFYLTILFMEVT
jgi:hypothetical protein